MICHIGSGNRIYKWPIIVSSATSLSGVKQFVMLSRYCRYSWLDICQQNTLTAVCSPHVLISLCEAWIFLVFIFAPIFFRNVENFPLSPRILVSIGSPSAKLSKNHVPFPFLTNPVPLYSPSNVCRNQNAATVVPRRQKPLLRIGPLDRFQVYIASP